MKKLIILLPLIFCLTHSSYTQDSQRFLRMPIGTGAGIFLDEDPSFGWELHTGLDFFPFKNISILKGFYTGAEFRYESLPESSSRSYIYGKAAYLFNPIKDSKYRPYAGIRHVLSFGKETFNDKINCQVINTRYLVAEPFIGVQRNNISLDINLMTDYRLKHIETGSGEKVNNAILYDRFGLFVRVQLFLFQ